MKISAWRQLPLPYPRQMKGDEIRRLCAGHKSGQESAIKMDLDDSKWQLLRYLNQPRHTALQAKSIYCVLRYQGHRSSAARKNRAPPTAAAKILLQCLQAFKVLSVSVSMKLNIICRHSSREWKSHMIVGLSSRAIW